MKRRPISVKTRFEVFKRDNFTCQYCGAHPPDVLLHVDHINPVSNGGQNDEVNLITSCQDCNLGKGKRLLSNRPKPLIDMVNEAWEKEQQLIGYNQILADISERVDSDAWTVVGALFGRDEVRRDWFFGIRNFVKNLPLQVVLDASEIANAKMPYSDNKRFRYFCGICWNRIKGGYENG